MNKENQTSDFCAIQNAKIQTISEAFAIHCEDVKHLLLYNPITINDLFEKAVQKQSGSCNYKLQNYCHTACIEAQMLYDIVCQPLIC